MLTLNKLRRSNLFRVTFVLAIALVVALQFIFPTGASAWNSNTETYLGRCQKPSNTIPGYYNLGRHWRNTNQGRTIHRHIIDVYGGGQIIMTPHV